MESVSHSKKSVLHYFSPTAKQKNFDAKEGISQKKRPGKQDMQQKVSRKSLQTIQKSSQSDGLVRPLEKSEKPKSFQVYEDKVEVRKGEKKTKSKQVIDVAVQSEVTECTCTCHTGQAAEDEAIRLMVEEDIPDDYWKQLAEARQQALNDTLEENQQLHEELAQLKEQNESLSELAGQADYFASILKEVVDDDGEQSTDSDHSAPDDP